MNRTAHRISLHTIFPFSVTLGAIFTATILFASAFAEALDSLSRFVAVVLTIGLFILAYFLHRASLSWIEISEDGKTVASIPSWYSRKFLCEQPTIVQMSPGSELLVCRRSAYGAFDGYYLILRTPQGGDQVLWNAESGISRRYWEKTARAIREQHHLETRLVTQFVSEGGMQEASWTAESDRMRWRNFKLLIGPLLFPWLGVVVRLSTPNPQKIIFVGILFWATGISVFWYLYRYRDVAKQPGLVTTALFWTLQFVGLYSVTVLATNAFLHR